MFGTLIVMTSVPHQPRAPPHVTGWGFSSWCETAMVVGISMFSHTPSPPSALPTPPHHVLVLCIGPADQGRGMRACLYLCPRWFAWIFCSFLLFNFLSDPGPRGIPTDGREAFPAFVVGCQFPLNLGFAEFWLYRYSRKSTNGPCWS